MLNVLNGKVKITFTYEEGIISDMTLQVVYCINCRKYSLVVIVDLYIYIHMHTYIYTYTFIHIYMYTYIHIHIHIMTMFWQTIKYFEKGVAFSIGSSGFVVGLEAGVIILTFIT